jgi:DNA modification methylase
MTTILTGDCRDMLRQLAEGDIDCCVTSPPYFGLRSYCPDKVTLKKDAPGWVSAELAKRGIFPVDRIKE